MNLLKGAAALGAAASFLFAAAPAAADDHKAYGIGPWGLTYSYYRAADYGPERPLEDLAAELRLPRDLEGRLAGARLLVVKDLRRAELWVGSTMVKAYRIQLSQRSRGTKEHRADQRTPEGEYYVCDREPSKYYRGLWLSYPNREDAARGLASGRLTQAQFDEIAAAIDMGACPPQDTKLGGLLLIHGQQGSLTRQYRRAPARRAGLRAGDADPRAYSMYFDWTAGCIAMFNGDVREVYDNLPARAKVTIVGDGPLTRPLSADRIQALRAAAPAVSAPPDAPPASAPQGASPASAPQGASPAVAQRGAPPVAAQQAASPAGATAPPYAAVPAPAPARRGRRGAAAPAEFPPPGPLAPPLAVALLAPEDVVVVPPISPSPFGPTPSTPDPMRASRFASLYANSGAAATESSAAAPRPRRRRSKKAAPVATKPAAKGKAASAAKPAAAEKKR
ncbi:MAG: L,D-transpeptidase family protein [Candidatus Polarisedimenticolia bacterium]